MNVREERTLSTVLTECGGKNSRQEKVWLSFELVWSLEYYAREGSANCLCQCGLGKLSRKGCYQLYLFSVFLGTLGREYC